MAFPTITKQKSSELPGVVTRCCPSAGGGGYEWNRWGMPVLEAALKDSLETAVN